MKESDNAAGVQADAVTNSLALPAQALGRRWRLSGFIPLGFFLLRLVDYVNWGTPAHIWWNCHIANLSLGLGLLSGNVTVMRLAALWLLLGVPPWALDMWEMRIVWPVSLLTHLGGAALALLVVAKVRMTRGIWPWALLWFVGLQGLSRWFTPPDKNVNVAHAIYPTAQPWFSRYWMFEGALLIAIAWLLWLLELALARLFPVRVSPLQNS